MKIAVNVRFLLKGRLEGMGVFTEQTFRRLTRQMPEHEFVFIFDRPYDSSYMFSNNVTPVVAYPPARHPLLWYLWYEWAIPAVLRRHKPDVFVSCDGYVSLRTDVPQLAVMHDLAFENYPADVPPLVSRYYRYYFPRFARKADRIATVSAFSEHDIHKRYGVPRDRIDVVYNGADERFRPMTADEIAAFKQEITGGTDYFVYVGAMHNRKNITNLLLAYDQFRRDTPTSETKLVLVGRKAWGNAEMERTYEAMLHRKDVIFAGSQEIERLRQYVGAAKAMTYVSYFEGFGIPIVEAMACDVPVVTSAVSSMPEVAGDAALLVDPFSPDSIAGALQRIDTAEALRRQLIEAARLQRRAFSWQQTADRMRDSILKTAG